MPMYRVYSEKEGWITDNVFLEPDGLISRLKRTLFGNKLMLLDDDYVYHNHISLNDKNGTPIYEGDFVEAEIKSVEEEVEDKIIIGEVVYEPRMASYILLVFDELKWYGLNEDICEFLTVVGNVIDTPHLISYKNEEEKEKTETTEE